MPSDVTPAAERIFLELIDLAAAQRADRLAAACAGDDTLNAEVQALLDAARRGPAYLEGLRERLGLAGLPASAAVEGIARRVAFEPAARVETGQFAPAPATAEVAGGSVGPYRLVRELGSGGMGSVWLAERTDLLQGRQVALKLPLHLSGAWKRAGLAERLAREREILATLEHPNIARLYDAGVTADGQPWLALEYVPGERIDLYCRSRGLPVADRLRLFLQVARAVAHAHAQLVVHRDLKPANILVTDGGDVKLLDFGIAKLVQEGADGGLAAESDLTRDGGRALTPDYASPEQILGQPIGTASDVYSLGVLLFELLADVRPYRLPRATRAALEEAIAAGDMPPPSARAPAPRRRQLRGDLDTIVLKALKREPAQRYATVAALAEDVQRHLDHQPVLARPDSAAYRLRTFVRRHRLAAGATAAVALALLSGAALAWWQATEAKAQRDAALRQQQRAEAVSDFLNVMFDSVGPDGRALTPAELLDRGVALLDAATGMDASLAANLLFDMSRRYATLGRSDTELQLLERARAAAVRLGDKSLQAGSECAIAKTLVDRNVKAARTHVEAADAALARATDVSATTDAHCIRARAQLAQSEGRRDEAVAVLQAGIERLRRAPVPQPGHLATLQLELGDLLFKADRTAESLAMVTEALAHYDRSGRTGTLGRAVAAFNLAALLARAGEVLASAEVQQRAMALASDVESDRGLPLGFGGHVASNLLRLARHDEALRLLEAERLRAQAAGNARFEALLELLLGRTLVKLDRHGEADERLAAAEQRLSVNAKANERLLNELVLTRADMLLRRGQAPAAAALAGEVLGRLGYPVQRVAPGLASALLMAGRAALASGDAAQAERLAADSLAMASTVARDVDASADVGQARALRARAWLAQGRAEPARDELQRALGALQSGFGPDHPETREVVALIDGPATAMPAR